MARLIVVAIALTTLASSPFGVPAAEAHDPRCGDKGVWEDFALEQLDRYPAMELPDLYKVLHQATLGSEHAVSFGDARDWLEAELSSLGRGPDESVLEALGPEPRFARIHLRPYLALGGDLEALVEAFVATARTPGDPAAFRCALESVREATAHGRLPWSAEVVTRYLDAKTNAGYPAEHHSAAFIKAYRPAYRVVALDLAPLATAPGPMK